MTGALADVPASAGQAKVAEEEKQKWELVRQGQDGPTAALDLATYNLACVTRAKVMREIPTNKVHI